MSTLTKICGLTTPETLDAAIKGGASHVGFVFFPKSPRNLTPDRAAQLAARVPSRVTIVGVFVDPDPAWLVGLRKSVRLDALQLHGSETPQFAASLGGEVWKAIRVRMRADLDRAHAYRGAVSRILYDAKTPEGELPGGMGLRFDWTLLEGFGHALPWGLSGGLDAGNVAEAVRITGAPLVDVSSGVESAPGVKDMDKIAAFLKATSLL